MPRIKHSALVHYTAEEMYHLVADVPKYGEFLPWCSGARVLQEEGDEVTAQVDIAFKSVKQSFTTVNKHEVGRQINMNLKDGPFSYLSGVWQFIDLDEQASKIMFDLEFHFSNRLARAVIGPVFSKIADGMVDAFQKRAVEIYGPRSL
ncbi:MAG: type II toxin-antitoxin system RatA family toxin [Gammaproteobacteria bacterium]|nr:MAG: type II toxin-antitoxin system RatA family toxin [Gammaproteobacteria bacterium]